MNRLYMSVINLSIEVESIFMFMIRKTSYSNYKSQIETVNTQFMKNKPGIFYGYTTWLNAYLFERKLDFQNIWNFFHIQ